MLDAEHVGARLGDERQQPGESARPVGDPRVAAQPATSAGLVALGHEREQAGVDVAAGQDDDGRPLDRGRDGPAEQRRHADRARALDDELGPLEQPHHRLGDVVLLDHAHLVDPAPDERQRERAGALDGDAVGDRRPDRGRRGVASRQAPRTARTPAPGPRRP